MLKKHPTLPSARQPPLCLVASLRVSNEAFFVNNSISELDLVNYAHPANNQQNLVRWFTDVSVDCGSQRLSENIWFVWFEHHIVEKSRCVTNSQKVKIKLKSVKQDM